MLFEKGWNVSERLETVFDGATCNSIIQDRYMCLLVPCNCSRDLVSEQLGRAMWSCETLMVGYEDVMMDALAGEEADVVKRLKELHLSAVHLEFCC